MAVKVVVNFRREVLREIGEGIERENIFTIDFNKTNNDSTSRNSPEVFANDCLTRTLRTERTEDCIELSGPRRKEERLSRKDRRSISRLLERSRRRSRGRSRGRSRDRSRGRSRGRSRDRSRCKSRRRSRGRSRGKSRGRSRGHSRGRSRRHSREKSRVRSKDRSRSRSRDQSHSKLKRSRCHSRGKSRDHSRENSRGRSHERTREHFGQKCRDPARPNSRVCTNVNRRCSGHNYGDTIESTMRMTSELFRRSSANF